MFFILFILTLFLIVNMIIIFSKIKIIVKDIRISTEKKDESYIQKNYKIILQLTMFSYIKIFNITVTNKKIKLLSRKGILKKVNKKIKENDTEFNIDTLRMLKNLNYEISNLDLKIDIGTENAATTALICGILSSGIGLIIKNSIYNEQNNYYKITPLYLNKILINLQLDCIITIKLIHIIYILYILSKKRRDGKYVRTSNRRSYAYSNE